MTPKLQGTVGPPMKKAVNKPDDVDLVSKMLWANGYDVPISKKITNKMLAAIPKAQKAARADQQDGIIKPGDKTVKALTAKYTAEARRIANAPKVYEVNFNNKCYIVGQKEYDEQKARTLELLTKYVAKMQETIKKLGDGHDLVVDMKNGQKTFLNWVAMTLVHVSYGIDYPDAKKRYAAEKAVKAFASAVKMKDFKKIAKTMPEAEKAATIWTKEFNRWWKEATGAEEKLQWWIATGQTTGWIAVGFFLAPASTAIAGGWGGAVLAAGMTGQAKYYVDNLDKMVNGTPSAAIKTGILSNVAAGKEMTKAAIGGAMGMGVAKFTPGIAARLMGRYPSLSKPVAEAWVQRALRSMSGLIDGIVADLIDSAADTVIGKGKTPPKPKTFEEQALNRIWDMLLAGAVGEIDDAFQKKWDPVTSPVTIDFLASASEIHTGRQQMAANQIKQWKSRLAVEVAKGTGGGVKGEVINHVLGKAKGTEKADQLVKMADKQLAASRTMKDLVHSIVAADAKSR